ncbi:alpha/beta hydrolase [Kutzneria viridogrisea]|uniref:AB hydrolase-1 domain-containing protein n=2 Tax=Kutzneria TaxID=43356 RepID=W5WEU6_9PSEU|nr:alpha/beta fold hydrolase [Kutzneria albida]AHH99372.1 hypothetical protein KALB_6012 [Kutzneria albida DSM 43870]MBA8923073.1 pimeloyl-ACP methyl ester carboxylesterase [Kutzneria viridogrisea]
MPTNTSLVVRRFEPTGTPTGPTVLLVHGFASDGHTDWIATGWPAALTATGRTVLVPDLPGHGSSPAAADTSPRGLVAALAKSVSGTGELDVIGYSLGARLAWELPGALPVRRLVLGGISPVEPFGAVDVAAVLDFASGGRLPADPLSAAIARMVTAPGRDPVALAACVAGLRQHPFSPAAGQLSVPTLFVGGAEDPICQGIEALAALVPGSELVLVPGDHGAALRGAAFRAAAAGFLDAP